MGADVTRAATWHAVPVTVTDDVRAACRAIAQDAQEVRIVPGTLGRVAAGPVPALDPADHYLEGSPDDVAAYILVLDAVNFGSGWFHELPGLGYASVARALAERWRLQGPLDARALRAMDGDAVAALLGQPATHELVRLYAAALRELGTWLGDRTALGVVRDAEPSAARLAATLAGGMPMWCDTGFLKRAQIAASDLALAGVARFTDLDGLTAFADNVLPQVLRCEGVLELAPALAARIDRGELLPAGPAERELRACAVHACELLALRLGLTPRELDNVLWTRGQEPGYATLPPHRTRSTFY
ncbi:MAG: hypothetical protein JWO02_2122 [Solirubrobacterales bacterium]|nr:hypothetical protein [Solirubrobacterales bacterium]